MKIYKSIVACTMVVMLSGCGDVKEKSIDYSQDETVVNSLEGYVVVQKEQIHDRVDKRDIDKYAYTLKKENHEIVLYTSGETLYNALENGYVVNVSYNRHKYIIKSTIFDK